MCSYRACSRTTLIFFLHKTNKKHTYITSFSLGQKGWGPAFPQCTSAVDSCVREVNVSLRGADNTSCSSQLPAEMKSGLQWPDKVSARPAH